MGTVSPVSQTDMKFLSFLLCVSLTAAAIVRREAEPGGYGAEPQCTVTPVKECKQRTVETPKKVCQTVVDKHEDTVVTETCEEEITTTCVQVSSTKHHSSKIVDRSSSLVETGVPRQIETKSVQHTGGRQVVSSGYSKREAQPDFVRKYSRPSTSTRYVSKPAPVVVHHVSAPVVKTAPAQTSPPECTSTPVKTCKNTPVSTPGQVSRQVCETVVDITYVEDCTETITKSCASSSTSHSATSRVTGHDLQVIAGGSVSGKAVTGGSY